MSEIYLGRPNQKIVLWCKEHYGPKDPGPLCFTAEEAGSTITLDSMAECAPIAEFYPNMNLQYSRDGNTWTAIDFTKTPEENTITLANVGDKVYFKAITENPVDEWDYGNSNPPCRWIMTGLIAAAGNIQSLLDSTYLRTDVPDNCYNSMFHNCASLTQAPALPATTLADNCYSYMFSDCTSLTQAPALPATTLADNCYSYMFYGCTSLTQAPELPATTLADNCYLSMFLGCTSLTQAPELPATILASYCYESMFLNCTSLTQAPALPATTLADFCYESMFYNCASLTQAPALSATTLADYCYSYMFYGCTSLTQAPELPATTLANSCYNSMFHNCASLTQAPALPATTLADFCYFGMFANCWKLTSINVNFSAWNPASATGAWMSNAGSEVTSEKTFTCPSTLPLTRGKNNILEGWTIVTK